MKRTSRVLAILLALAMLFSVTAFATWNVYGGNDNHNAKVDTAPTTKTSETAVSLTPSITTGWDGVDNVPVMQTVKEAGEDGEDGEDITYAYVLFDGRGTNGAQVIKYDCTYGEEVWRTTAYGNEGTSLNAKSGFQLSTPYLDEDAGILYVGVISQYDDYTGGEWLTGTGSKILAISNLGAELPTVTNVVTGINGQINTPIVKYGNYLYFGTWTGSAGGTYYQYNMKTKVMRTVDSSDRGFYWAGAVEKGNYVYFGSDADKTDKVSQLHYRKESAFATTGGTVNLPSYAGNIRSTIMTDGENLYFTSQGGYLWCYTPNADGVPVESWHAALGATSTSTPTKVGNRIYVGAYSGFNKGGVLCVNASTHAVTPVVAIANANNFPVQCSIVVMGNGSGTDYVYFNTNSSVGCGYCYSFDGSTGTQVWKTTADTYALGGMACDNGILVFGNDHNNLYIVK